MWQYTCILKSFLLVALTHLSLSKTLSAEYITVNFPLKVTHGIDSKLVVCPLCQTNGT